MRKANTGKKLSTLLSCLASNIYESKSWFSQIYARVKGNTEQHFLHSLVETLIIPNSSFKHADAFSLNETMRQFETRCSSNKFSRVAFTSVANKFEFGSELYTDWIFTKFWSLHLVEPFINFSANSNITWMGGCLNKRYFHIQIH